MSGLGAAAGGHHVAGLGMEVGVKAPADATIVPEPEALGLDGGVRSGSLGGAPLCS
jgi:hypothetical protein